VDFFPQLWTPTAKDQVQGLTQRYWSEYIRTSASSSGFSFGQDIMTSPPDVARVVKGFCLRAEPASGSVVVFYFVSKRLPGSGDDLLRVVGKNLSQNPTSEPAFDYGPLSFLLTPGERIVLAINFSATAVHAWDFSCWGYEFPRGDLQR
jgi:hypothetical protein